MAFAQLVALALLLAQSLCLPAQAWLFPTARAAAAAAQPPQGTIRAEQLSFEPRITRYHNFLSLAECEHLIKLAKGHMEESTVVDAGSGRSVPSSVRTSSGTFLTFHQDETVSAIEDRIARFSLVPVDHGEGLQILQYEHNEKYEAHWDYFSDTFNTKNGGQRIATMLLYLTDVKEGGETVFPDTTPKDYQKQSNWSTCAQRGLAVKAKQGDALLFFSQSTSGDTEPLSLHMGCPVLSDDEKWSATKWMRVDHYNHF